MDMQDNGGNIVSHINDQCSTSRFLQCQSVINWNLILAADARPIRTACEVGVGPLDISMLPYFSEGYSGSWACDRLIGVEPEPVAAAAARLIGNAEITEAAITDGRTKAILVMADGSSYISGTWKPTEFMTALPAVVVKGIGFADIDDGKIDVLNIDCEGAEWLVLQSLVNRPRIIGIEVWPQHPDAQRILGWLLDEGYEIALKCGPMEETQVWFMGGVPHNKQQEGE